MDKTADFMRNFPAPRQIFSERTAQLPSQEKGKQKQGKKIQ